MAVGFEVSTSAVVGPLMPLGLTLACSRFRFCKSSAYYTRREQYDLLLTLELGPPILEEY
jgi:hypothetical protein